MAIRSIFLAVLGIVLLQSCGNNKSLTTDTVVQEKETNIESKDTIFSLDGVVLEPIIKADDEWKLELSTFDYNVLRRQGTERAFSGTYWDNKNAGVYYCKGCETPLFDSKSKFKSGTGWPSYYEPILDGNVTLITDSSHGMSRVEVVCARCKGHLGHVFPDGPAPTGMRYCINSASLNFKD